MLVSRDRNLLSMVSRCSKIELYATGHVESEVFVMGGGAKDPSTWGE